ncbi:NADH-dependent FMN reductase [Azospirillum sp. TSH100]|uniref:FMN reductase n=1 Tax=Azospirillum sp. TSH100 TaxID=652764 RepID=UPI000D61B84B|nr:FMN reductase [Azospirillum sp. TSH100]PWC84616.1 NADH-dependent FMN reductase [Azospirillum sp. TSH100]QCG91040.1 FMN reductase [Azospirillum sp. TSH100]
MGKIKVVTVSGNLGARSRTRALIDAVVEGVEARTPIHRTDIVVGELAPELGSLTDPKAIPPRVADALAAITGADLLVVGTPVYKGSYTGLFKHLIDFIDPNALGGVPVVLTATGGSPRHALVIEHQLRPLFGFFLAHTVPTGVFAQDSDFADYRLTSPEIAARTARAADEAVRIVALGRLAAPAAASLAAA